MPDSNFFTNFPTSTETDRLVMIPIRYILASVASLIILSGGFVLVRVVQKSILDDFRQSIREARDAGDLPEEYDNVDIDTLPLADFGSEVSSEMMMKIDLVDFISAFWYVWIIVVPACCFAVAHWFRKPSP